MKKINIFLILAIGLFTLFCFYFYYKATGGYVHFSDGAKYADVAKNLVLGKGYGLDFSFFDKAIFNRITTPIFSAGSLPVLMPLSISIFIRFFGINDLSLILTSGTYFFLLVFSVFLLSKKFFGKLVGLMSALAVAANLNFLDYATSGASEPAFSFLAVLSAYLIFIKKRWGDILFLTGLVLLYLTRPQGVVFIVGLLFVWTLTKFDFRKAVIIFLTSIVAVLLLDKFVIYPLSFKYPVYPIVTRGVQAVFQYSPAESVSNALRGQLSGVVGFTDVAKKTFYNLYNFYKLFPDIYSPYVLAFFVLSIFVWKKEDSDNNLKLLTLILFVGSLVLTSLTIPFFRYLHPVLPFIYIIGISKLAKVVRMFIGKPWLSSLVICSLVTIFVLGQTAGFLFLDSRFMARTHNAGKPPVFVVLSKVLKENTKEDSLTVTNLDTWGSWYGERRTVWFPLSPEMLINPITGQVPFDNIYLTSYLINDENYYMGLEWRQIFDNPKDKTKWVCEGCEVIAKEFKLQGEYVIDGQENYENEVARAILLVRK